jgi:hypothetical protein
MNGLIRNLLLLKGMADKLMMLGVMEIHLNQQIHCVLTMEDIYILWSTLCSIAKQRCHYVWCAEHGGNERRIGLNISNEDEELHRLLILDIQKLILTNRSDKICQWMKFPIYFATTLSIDGGGVRGIIPSLVLAALEAKL